MTKPNRCTKCLRYFCSCEREHKKMNSNDCFGKYFMELFDCQDCLVKNSCHHKYLEKIMESEKNE